MTTETRHNTSVRPARRSGRGRPDATAVLRSIAAISGDWQSTGLLHLVFMAPDYYADGESGGKA